MHSDYLRSLVIIILQAVAAVKQDNWQLELSNEHFSLKYKTNFISSIVHSLYNTRLFARLLGLSRSVPAFEHGQNVELEVGGGGEEGNAVSGRHQPEVQRLNRKPEGGGGCPGRQQLQSTGRCSNIMIHDQF